MNDIIILIITHGIAFVAGIVIDMFLLRKIKFVDADRVEVDLNAMIRIMVLLSIFLTSLASIIDSQFFGGPETSLVLTLGGAYAFGSLIGEGDFFKKIISAIIARKP